MTTEKNEVEENFKLEFQALLDKYGAEFELGDDGKPYGLHTATAKISICGGLYDEYMEFDL